MGPLAMAAAPARGHAWAMNDHLEVLRAMRARAFEVGGPERAARPPGACSWR